MTKIRLPVEETPSGWVLVESSLGGDGRKYISSLLVRRRSTPGETEQLLLPVMPDGRIYELVYLPKDMTGLVWQLPENRRFEQPRLTIRRVGWAERVWRMANRVVKTYARLPNEQRSESGLSLRRALRNLPDAYRIASSFRIRTEQWNYPEWVERFDTLSDQDCRLIREHIARFPEHPHFWALLVVDVEEREAIWMTLGSLRNQFYQNFTCVVLDCYGALDSSFDPDTELRNVGTGSRFVAQEGIADWLAEFNASLARERARQWVLRLRAGDVLPPHSLYWFACEILARPDVAIVYSDEDSLDNEGRRTHPRFKPDWSLAHLRATHFVGDAAVLRGGAVAEAGGITPDCCRYGNYDLLLRMVDAAGNAGAGIVAHVPAVLMHCKPPFSDLLPYGRRREGKVSSGEEGTGGRGLLFGRKRKDSVFPHERAKEETNALSASGGEGGSGGVKSREDWHKAALRRHLERNAIDAEVVDTRPGLRRVRFRLPAHPPLVSILVPTRDALPLLRRCMESVREKTTYRRFEILVIDNRSSNPRALAYLSGINGSPGVRVLRYDRPFNYSAINNFAVHYARGEVLCLLNNDTEVISPDWLDEMVGHLLQPRVGAVGAKLHYPGGYVQHAGVTIGPGGCANHLHAFIASDDPGYCGRAMVAQELSAVTGACMVTWRDLYLRLGGLNERQLKVAFNDVDYCLRVREAGYRVVWTPHAELYHHESATRGRDDSLPRQIRAQREIRYMRVRWREQMRNDPYYNLNFSYRRADFSLGETMRVRKPWRE